MKGMTIKIHTVNARLETIYDTVEKKQTEEVCSNTRVVNEHINEGENIVKTRYGRIVKKPDRLTVKNVKWLPPLLAQKKHFYVQLSCPPDIPFCIMHMSNSFSLT